MAKHILNTSEDDLNFILIGISCAEDQYRCVSLINDSLGIELALSDFLPLLTKDDKVFKFSLFSYIDEDLRLEFNCIPNNSNFDEPNVNQSLNTDLFSGVHLDESTKLIRELPKTDYFLLLKGDEAMIYQFKVIDKLKQIPEIIQIQSIAAQELPSKKYLIF